MKGQRRAEEEEEEGETLKEKVLNKSVRCFDGKSMQLCLLSSAPMPLLLPPLTRRMINVPPRWVGYHLKAEAEKQFEERGRGGATVAPL